MPASQAGRRGFEPRLPLHLFNNLGESDNFFHSISLREAATEGFPFAFLGSVVSESASFFSLLRQG
jgi:hypothetical protein